MSNRRLHIAFAISVFAIAFSVAGIRSADASTGYFSCALTASGGVKCWGYNSSGGLGNGSFTPSPPYGIATPVDVVGLTSGVVQMTVGRLHACALTMSGGVKCWGANQYGQLGNGVFNPGSAVPVDVVGLTSGVVHVSAGENHTCAVLVTGAAMCWGDNELGQLGTGTFSPGPLYGIATPASVIGLASGVAQISAGSSHSCAVTTSGAVKCWGHNGIGQLGNSASPTTATPVNATGLTTGATQVKAGGDTSCAITAGGGVKCWGAGGYGSIGNGSFLDRFDPVSVVGLASGVQQLSLGYRHACAVTSSGGIKCWGSNAFGQIGDGGPLNSRTTPVDVSGFTSGAVQVSAGFYHTCALTTGGGAKCWGYNEHGQLGNGTFSIAYPWFTVTPGDVSGLTIGVAQLWDGNPVLMDSDAPTAAPTQSPAPNGAGWNNSDVVVTWHWTDGEGSGIDAAHCTSSSTTSSEGSAIAVTASCKDVAGNSGNASYTVKVDKTKPTIAVAAATAPNGAGWYSADVTVHFTCADALSGLAVNGCPVDEILSAEGADVTSAATTALDNAGNISDLSGAVTVKIDKTAPTAAPTQSPAPNGAGWNNSDVVVTWHWTDNGGSGIDAANCTSSSTSSGEGNSIEVTASCKDVAGNSSNASYTVTVDKTKPTIAAAAATAPNGAGWYSADVTIQFTCADTLSGIATCPVDQILTAEGAAVTSTAATALDNAGNISDLSGAVTVKIDKTAPTAAPTQSPAANGAGWNSSDVVVTWNWTDNGSGIDAANCTSSSTTSGEGNAIAVTASCNDLAGNAGSASYTVTVDKTKPTIAVAAATAPNGAGWYSADVAIQFTCADALSGIAVNGCPVDQILSAEGAAVTSTAATALDNAGNISDLSGEVTVKIDKTAPTISASTTVSPNGAGWYGGNVTVAFTCADNLSGIATCPVDQVLTAEGAAISSTAGTALDAAGNASGVSNTVTIKIDKTAPTISAAATTSPNGAGWDSGNVTVAFTCADNLSGITTCPVDQVLTAEGAAISSTARVVADNADNTSAPSNVVTASIDKTKPLVSLSGGPADGASYDLGGVPAAPTCSGSDALSGLVSCTISGYDTGVGSHTVTATARDRAGNESSVSATYGVRGWTFSGFYQPVAVGAVNIVKGGSNVPLKFRVLAGARELVDVSAVVQRVTVRPCDEGATCATEPGDPNLRYDLIGGQFVYDWKAPKKPGFCYVVTVTLKDGTSQSARFSLK